LDTSRADTTITVVQNQVGPMEKTIPQARPGEVFLF
jgi:hypothetical protein